MLRSCILKAMRAQKQASSQALAGPGYLRSRFISSWFGSFPIPQHGTRFFAGTLPRSRKSEAIDTAFAGAEQAESGDFAESMSTPFGEQSAAFGSEQEKKRIYEETNIYHEDFKQQLMEYCHYY